MKQEKPRHLRSGEAAEERALAWLRSQGLALVARNYRCKAGEIDLVMRDGESLVFVEVRYRSHRGFGSAAESVTPAKQRRLQRAASHYLQRLSRVPPCRFDIIGVDADNRIDWIRNAF
ncbi:MAG TPA: YraN family protein [Sedimenticola sp.]|nr:YraN family protein [Sedimenticola sp.]